MNNDICFVGIDGGGSHSKAVMVDSELRILRKANGDCLNFYSIPFDRARENFHALISQLLKGMDVARVRSVFIGMSALDTEETPEKIRLFAGGIFPNASVFMHSDLYIALMSFTLGNPGVMLVSGTGTMAIAMDTFGVEHVMGGYGYLLGDQGSAYSIAVDALRMALLAFDGIGPETALQQAMVDHFQLVNHRDIIERIYTCENPRKYISSFATCVTSVAQDGDAGAHAVLRENARYLAEMTKSLILRINLPRLDKIGMYGGVFENDPLINKYFREYIHADYPSLRIEKPIITSEMGAAIAAMSRCGVSVDFDALVKRGG